MKDLQTQEQTLIEVSMPYDWTYYDLIKFAVEGRTL